MEKQKRWQAFIIYIVILLTVYNILPTVFYYSKPLETPVSAARAKQTAVSIAKRVNRLETQSVEWIQSFCRLLKIKPASIDDHTTNPGEISVTFKSVEDARKFEKFLPRAGELIPFVPAQLSLLKHDAGVADKTVTVARRIPVRLDTDQINTYFEFSEKRDANGAVTPLYRTIVQDRALELGLSIAGTTENAQAAMAAPGDLTDPGAQEFLLNTAQNIVSFVKAFGQKSAIANRYFASFSQIDTTDRAGLIDQFVTSLDKLSTSLQIEKNALEEEKRQKSASGGFLETVKKQRLESLTNKVVTLNTAAKIIKDHKASFAAGNAPLNNASADALIKNAQDNQSGWQDISLGDRNPFIRQLQIDWRSEKIYLTLHSDVLAYQEKLDNSEYQSIREQVNQFLYDEIAAVSRKSGETITPSSERFEISLNTLENSQSFLVMPLEVVAQAQVKQIKDHLVKNWAPSHPDLTAENFPIWDWATYEALPPAQKRLGLVIYSPSMDTKEGTAPKGFRMNSIYVIAKGMEKILKKLEHAPNADSSKQFIADFTSLRQTLQNGGFFGYPASPYVFTSDYKGDFIFEAQDYYQTLLNATRENFAVHGTKRYAVLEFSDIEQRLLTENKIDNRVHEDLLKWKDNYGAAQLGLRGMEYYDVPKPTQNPLLSNLKLSFKKYFRGDDRKILHWGLDLSGGKTVQIELRDSNNRTVTNEADINQGINELYNRVNKMGVSEVGIRQEGNFITLDFPGSQGLSASDLVKASSMHFHVVNEKFAPSNVELTDHVNRFLQEVWNEAVVTQKKDIDDINAIAYKHFYGDASDPDLVQPQSAAAKALYDQGLRLANPHEMAQTSTFDDTFSKIAMYRGDDATQWNGQTNPLLIVFNNYALEGSDLDNIQASYDPSKGNYLAFNVRSSKTTASGQKSKPQAELYAWTSQFSKEKIAGTPNETYSHGRGWRMAVILNGSVISAPSLESPLRDSAMITGTFTRREVTNLEADLKAGSLSFTPKILSEKNVSPELGSSEKSRGILSTAIGIVLVILTMLIYYRFGGFIASIAVLFNLLIMWATLQNLDATLTLAGIAGIILTMGMAVDANVLVFERIREEFAKSNRIGSAISTGYRKAFSAIVDSNLTTIIAAIILLQFDSGPIRGFAVTLIIGIVSSMFTALFMTRNYFNYWARNPKHQVLKMANWIKSTKVNFLKYSKLVGLFSLIIIVIGAGLGYAKKSSIFGMDFTGGYALTVEIEPTQDGNYRHLVEQALAAQGTTGQDFQIRELNPSNNLRIFLSRGLDQPGRPFFGMPLELEQKELGYSFESNPRLVWIVNALKEGGVTLSAQSLERLDKNWTDVSGQISDAMRNNAIIGLSIALLCILIYITARFEFTFALSATCCLIHDVLISLGALAVLHYLGAPIQIDLNTVAALMTIVGYSLNDTIIVFDRIRENIKLNRKMPLAELINLSLNTTLSRTTLTSLTTFLVLLPLVLFGGTTLFGFALVMLLGVVFGTLSSLFIAAPLMLYFHKRQEKKRELEA